MCVKLRSLHPSRLCRFVVILSKAHRSLWTLLSAFAPFLTQRFLSNTSTAGDQRDDTVGGDEDDVYFYTGERPKLEGET